MAEGKRKRIVVDFDITMGVPGCDVDDGLALLMLLGNSGLCTVEGLCASYGNSDIGTTYDTARRIAETWRLDVPVLRGGASPTEPESEAADFLARMAAENPGELSVLATGSLTNLRGAALADPAFFENVAEVALMGGITQSLAINGRIMDELNMSCDPDAAYAVLAATRNASEGSAGCPVHIATAQNCLPAFFNRRDFIDLRGPDSWFYRTCDYWFADMDERYAWNGFTCWDIVAATYLIRPDLFVDDWRDVALDRRLFSVGFLDANPMDGAPAAHVNLPRIVDAEAFRQAAFDGWRRALEPLGL